MYASQYYIHVQNISIFEIHENTFKSEKHLSHKAKAYRNISSLFINNLTKTCHIKIVYSPRLTVLYALWSPTSCCSWILDVLPRPIIEAQLVSSFSNHKYMSKGSKILKSLNFSLMSTSWKITIYHPSSTPFTSSCISLSLSFICTSTLLKVI